MAYKFKMTNRIRALLTLACAVTAWFIATPSDTWRYRMTVTLQTANGEKTGSAVREVTVHTGIGLTGLPPTMDISGEAVAVEIAPKEYVFALLVDETHGEDYAGNIFVAAFPAKKKEGRATLPASQYPMLVRFDSLTAPKTVARATVPVKEITLEVTEEPVSWGLRKILPWLPNYGFLRLDGEVFVREKADYPLANALKSQTFSTEPEHK